MVLEVDSTVCYVSPLGRGILWCHPDEIAGTELPRYLHPEDTGWSLNHITGRRGSIRNPPAPVLFPMRHADASWRGISAWGRVVAFFVDLDGFKAVNDEGNTEPAIGFSPRWEGTSKHTSDRLVPRLTSAKSSSPFCSNTSGVDPAAYVAKLVVETLRTPVTLGNCALSLWTGVGVSHVRQRPPPRTGRWRRAAIYYMVASGALDYSLSEEEAYGGIAGVWCSTSRE
jgi:hypothetical protein